MRKPSSTTYPFHYYASLAMVIGGSVVGIYYSLRTTMEALKAPISQAPEGPVEAPEGVSTAPQSAVYMEGSCCIIKTSPDTTGADIVKLARECAKAHETHLGITSPTLSY